MAGNQNAEQRNFEMSKDILGAYEWLYLNDTCDIDAPAIGDVIDEELQRRGTYKLRTGEYKDVLDWLGHSYSAREIAQFLIEKRRN